VWTLAAAFVSKEVEDVDDKEEDDDDEDEDEEEDEEEDEGDDEGVLIISLSLLFRDVI
jgi:hypothetical protein